MTESMLLALAGGAVALPLAAAVIRFRLANAPSGSPGALVGVRAVLFTMALAAAVGWACGLLAARHAGRGGLGDALGAASPAGAAGARALPGRRFRRWLVVVETALALALLATAGLALKTFLLLRALAAAGIFGAVSARLRCGAGRSPFARRSVPPGRRCCAWSCARGLSLAGRGALLGIAGVMPFRLGMLCLPPEGDVPGSDAAVVAAVALLLLAVAGLAGALPAARAARRDLGAALRDR